MTILSGGSQPKMDSAQVIPGETAAPAQKNEKLLGQLLWLSLPVLAEHILHMVVGWNDTYLANHLPAERSAAGAAVGTVQYFFWFTGLFAGAVATGSTAIIARAIGAKHRSLANSVCAQSILFAALIGCGMGLITLVLAGALAKLTGLHGTAHD